MHPAGAPEPVTRVSAPPLGGGRVGRVEICSAGMLVQEEEEEQVQGEGQGVQRGGEALMHGRGLAGAGVSGLQSAVCV